MSGMVDLVDGDYLKRLGEQGIQDNLEWVRQQTAPPPTQPFKPMTPQLAAAADTFWSDYLTTTTADVGDVLLRGVSMGIIQPKHLGPLGEIIEKYRTPDERKSTLRKIGEGAVELASGMIVGGPLLNPVGRAASAALLGKGAGLVAKGAVAGAAEGAVVGAAQAGVETVRGEETLKGAALKIGGGVLLGGVLGGAAGKIESLVAARAARSAKRVAGLQEEAAGAEAAAVTEYEQATLQWAKGLDEAVQPKAAEPVDVRAEATSIPGAPGRPIPAGPIPEPKPVALEALPSGPPEPPVETADPRALLKAADRLEAAKEGMGARGKAGLDERITALRQEAMQVQAVDATLAAVEDAKASGLGKDLETAAQKWARRQKLITGSQKGEINTQFIGSIAGAAVGGLAGGATGDTPEARIRNALIGAAVGGGMSALLLRKLSSGIAKAATGAAGEATAAAAGAGPEPAVVTKPTAKVKIADIGTEQAQTIMDEATAKGVVDYQGKRYSVPIDEVTDSPTLDEMVRIIARERKADIEAARRGTITVEARQAMGEKLAKELGEKYGIPLTHYLAMPRGTALNVENIEAFRIISEQSMNELRSMLTLPKSGEVDAQIVHRLSILNAIIAKRFGFAAESGRALPAWGGVKLGGTLSETNISKLGELLDTDAGALALKHGVTPGQLADMVRAMAEKDAKATGQSLGQWMSKAQNGMMEAWINGLLSGPPTMVANLVGDVIPVFLGPLERSVAARIGTGADRVVVGEATEMLYGLWAGLDDAWRAAAKSYRTGESAWAAMSGKAEAPRRAISSQAFGIDPESQLGHGVDLLGHVVRQPGSILAATDEFFKLLNFRMQQHALTWREARRLADQTGGDMATILGSLRADVPDSIQTAAKQYGDYQTYTNKLGEFGQKLIHVSNSNLVAKSVLPFIQTPINLAKYTLERIPGVNLVLGQIRADIAAGGPARDLALAKMALGGMFAGTAAVYAASGGITGAGPKDPVLRRRLMETGWQPYSLKVGDTYYSFSRLDPIGMALGMVADYGEIVGNVDDPTAGQMGLAVVATLLKNITSKTYVQGLSNALEAIMNPESKGFQTYFELQARTLVPRALAVLTRTEMDPTSREVNGYFDAIRSQIPGLSDALPPRRNLYGEPVMLEGSLGPDYVSPIYARALKRDPVADEIAKHRLRVDGASDWISGRRPGESPFAEDRATNGVSLTPQQKDRWAVLMGRGRDTSLHEALANLISSESYQHMTDGPDGSKALAISQLVSRYREDAKRRLLEEDPALFVAVENRRQQRIAARTVQLGIQ